MKRLLTSCIALALAGSNLASLPAWAQEPAGEQGRTQAGEKDGKHDKTTVALAPVIVEGTRVFGMPPSEQTGGYTVDAATVGSRTSTLLRGIPQSITVITRQRIEDQNLDTLDEMAKHTPGMRVLTNDIGRSSIYARGYEYSQFNLDGLPAPMASINGTLPSLAAVDRVELMRGPSGLLNSTSELGGIVNLVLKRPTSEPHVNLLGQYGSFSQYRLMGDVAGPLTAGGKLRGRLVVAHDHTDGFTDFGGNTGKTFYGALDADLGAHTTGFLALLHQDRDITVSNGLPTAADGSLLDIDRGTFAGARWNSFEGRSSDVIGELRHDFSALSQGRLGVRYSDRDAGCNYLFGGGPLADDGTVAVVGLGCDVGQTSLSMDGSYSMVFDLAGNPGEFVVGVDHKRFATDATRARYNPHVSVPLPDFADLPFVDILASPDARSQAMETTLKETGAYAKATVRPWQNLAVIAGARLSRYRIEQSNKANGQLDSGEESGKVTPYLGLILDLGLDHSLYASYSKVFTPQTEADKDGNLIQPRTGTQYEVGLKGSYFQGAINARASAFRLYDRHHAASVPGQHYAAELDSRRVQGAEIEVNGAVTANLDLVAGYTWLDTEVDAGSMHRGDPAAIYLLMPENSFKLWAKYSFANNVLEGLSLAGGLTTSSGFRSSQGIRAPEYQVVDVMASWTFSDRCSVQLNVTNLLDEKYYSRVGSTGTFNFYGPPRGAVLSLRYAF